MVPRLDRVDAASSSARERCSPGWDAEMPKRARRRALYYTWRAVVAFDQLSSAGASARRPGHRSGPGEGIASARRRRKALTWSRWKWGAINRSTFPHPLIAAYDLPAAQRDGGGGTVHAIGSVYQLITDFSNLDESLVTIAPGESGQPGSPFYGNLVDSWTRREPFRLAFTRPAVDAHAKYRLTLRAR